MGRIWWLRIGRNVGVTDCVGLVALPDGALQPPLKKAEQPLRSRQWLLRFQPGTLVGDGLSIAVSHVRTRSIASCLEVTPS